MPFRSEAQRRKFSELVKAGKVSSAEFSRLSAETGKKKLPERVSKPKQQAPRSGRR